MSSSSSLSSPHSQTTPQHKPGEEEGDTNSCFRCRRVLEGECTIHMYRDMSFCSKECRHGQMKCDEYVRCLRDTIKQTFKGTYLPIEPEASSRPCRSASSPMKMPCVLPGPSTTSTTDEIVGHIGSPPSSDTSERNSVQNHAKNSTRPLDRKDSTGGLRQRYGISEVFRSAHVVSYTGTRFMKSLGFETLLLSVDEKSGGITEHALHSPQPGDVVAGLIQWQVEPRHKRYAAVRTTPVLMCWASRARVEVMACFECYGLGSVSNSKVFINPMMKIRDAIKFDSINALRQRVRRDQEIAQRLWEAVEARELNSQFKSDDNSHNTCISPCSFGVCLEEVWNNIDYDY
mmetsp:Transcript_21651/g.30324  ORF Transcript_21651/g.30324 Transcript_21651/m.30324 type:complete len:345 (+) Transcript_21651:237-1271(+)